MPISDHVPSEAISEQAIRERAYALYEARGREEGHAAEDWVQAESELFGEVHRQEAA